MQLMLSTPSAQTASSLSKEVASTSGEILFKDSLSLFKAIVTRRCPHALSYDRALSQSALSQSAEGSCTTDDPKWICCMSHSDRLLKAEDSGKFSLTISTYFTGAVSIGATASSQIRPSCKSIRSVFPVLLIPVTGLLPLVRL